MLSSVRRRTSSRQSPIMSPCRQGVALVPLFDAAPVKVASGLQTPAFQSYLETTFLSSNSRSRSPSHHTAMLVEKLSISGLITSPFILRSPFDSHDHISTPGFVGSISAAIQRPTSVPLFTWNKTLPVAASRKLEPSLLFSWQSHTWSPFIVGENFVRCMASPCPIPVE